MGYRDEQEIISKKPPMSNVASFFILMAKPTV